MQNFILRHDNSNFNISSRVWKCNKRNKSYNLHNSPHKNRKAGADHRAKPQLYGTPTITYNTNIHYNKVSTLI